jgi:hypothetical protein
MTGMLDPCHRWRGSALAIKTVLIGIDDLIEIIPGIHISSVAIGPSADADPE